MAHDPLPAHSEAVERYGSVLREAYRASLCALGSNKATAHLLDFVEAAGITDTPTAVDQCGWFSWVARWLARARYLRP